MKVRDRTILVVGLARSGVAAGALLRRHGARVVGVDDAPEASVAERWRAADLEGRATEAFDEIRTGGDWGDLAATAPWAVALSPGVPRRHPRLRELPAEVPVWGEVEWGARFCAATMVAITGTNGKSTTTELAAHLLSSAGREAAAMGNVGRPFCDRADTLPAEAVAVLEVSSFQLETVASFAPRVGTLLNLAPDHLDRYEDIYGYYAAKRRLVEQLPRDGTFVTWTGCAEARDWRPDGPRLLFGAEAGGARVVLDELTGPESAPEEAFLWLRDGEKTIPLIRRTELPLTAPVHHLNAAAAVATVLPLGVDPAALTAGLRDFRGLAHRHELVAELADVRFVDDSKATNVHAVCGGLQDYPAPVALIVGGRGKNEDYAPLRAAMGPVRAVITLGEEGPAIGAVVADRVAVEHASDLPDAVRRAHARVREGGTVLLSPACASFDMFRDYGERGLAFAAAARALGARPPQPRDDGEESA